MYVDPNLPRHIFGWYSPRLEIEMPIVSYGESGHPLLLFPVADTDFLHYERAHFIRAIEPHIATGKVRIFSVDGIGRHAFLCPNVSPPEAARRHAQYSRYIEEEVVPHIRSVIGAPHARIAVAGADFGAFLAANQLFRRPDLFDFLVGISGTYDLVDRYTKGYFDDDIYFNNPPSFLPGLDDEKTLYLLRNECQIHLVSGRGPGESPEETKALASLLAYKQIPANLDLWGHDVDHSFAWWNRIIDYYIGQRLGF